MKFIHVIMFLFLLNFVSPAIAEGFELRFLDGTTSWVSYEDAMRQRKSPTIPVNTPKDAIIYAISEGLPGKVPVKKLKEKGYSLWIFTVRKRTPSLSARILHDRLEEGEISKADYEAYAKDIAEAGTFWEVKLKSRGMEPEYFCSLNFRATGEVLLLLEEDCNFEHGSLD